MSTKKVAVLEEFTWQQPTKDKDLSSPPESPAKGDRYIVAATGSGAWTGQTGNIALCTVGGGTPSWEFIIKTEGMICWVEDEDKYYKYISSWTEYLGATGPQGPTGPTGPSGVGKNVIILKVLSDDELLATGDGQMRITIPSAYNGMNLIEAHAHVYTVSTSGLPTIAIYNQTDSHDMLSTNITIDANENDSKDASTQPVIDTNYDDVATGDVIRVDCDVAGTGTKGLEIRLTFQTP